MENKLIVMLQLQDQMNQKVHSHWRDQGFEWYRAIWVECAELMDHYGWKWWKKQEPDREQVILELVDIWHFGLSQMLESEADLSVLTKKIVSGLDLSSEPKDFKLSVEEFSEAVLRAKAFDLKAFSGMMVAIGLSFDQLFQGYIGKNVLNLFRQDHGYKQGTYSKVWGGMEDNEHLVEIVRSLNSGDTDFQQAIYKGLKARYPD